jgi:tetratricopeptide (TPR) repeat protein
MPDENVAREMMQRAYECLGKYDTGGAIQIGEQLRKMRFTGGYEVLALAYQIEGKLEKAVRILREGVKQAPDSWLLWQQLGNLYSDRGEFDKAHESYDRALQCPDADASNIALYRANVLHRQGEYEMALHLLDSVTDADARNQGVALRVTLLNSLYRHEEAMTLSKQTIAHLEVSEHRNEPDVRHDLARLHAELAVAYKKMQLPPEMVLAEIREALSSERTNSFAMRLMREHRNQKSTASKHFWLQLKGTWDAPILADEESQIEEFVPDFYVNFDVVADSPEEALTFCRDFEPEAVRASLQVDDVEELESCPEELKGVYGCTGHAFYDPRQE